MSTGTDVFMNRYVAWAKLADDLADDVLGGKDSNGKVGLIGFSNGGILATGASALDPRINAAVIYYGSVPFPIMDHVKRFPPLLILHGEADDIIPAERGKELAVFARQLGGSADVVIYPGTGHGFGARLDTKEADDALSRTIVFLGKELDAHSP
jgi:carboxymethylenebutenolidase